MWVYVSENDGAHASCRNRAASQRRSCARRCSTRPSRRPASKHQVWANSRLAPGLQCHLPHRRRRHGPLHPPKEHAGRRGLSLRAVQEEETSILTVRVALVLPPHWLMADSGAQMCMRRRGQYLEVPIRQLQQLTACEDGSRSGQQGDCQRHPPVYEREHKKPDVHQTRSTRTMTMSGEGGEGWGGCFGCPDPPTFFAHAVTH